MCDRRISRARGAPILLFQDSYATPVSLKHLRGSVGRAIIDSHNFELAVESLAEDTIDRARNDVCAVEDRDHDYDLRHRRTISYRGNFTASVPTEPGENFG
jgi:hypothetical protein